MLFAAHSRKEDLSFGASTGIITNFGHRSKCKLIRNFIDKLPIKEHPISHKWALYQLFSRMKWIFQARNAIIYGATHNNRRFWIVNRKKNWSCEPNRPALILVAQNISRRNQEIKRFYANRSRVIFQNLAEKAKWLINVHF